MEPLNASLPTETVLPPIAGGAPAPGEELLNDTRFMGEQTARSVTRRVESWQAMPRSEFEACAEHL